MSSRCLDPRAMCAAAALALCGAVHAAAPAPAAELRVCADPANLPYSQRDESGFENRIARLVADDLGMRLRWFWQEQTRGFVRKTMGRASATCSSACRPASTRCCARVPITARPMWR